MISCPYSTDCAGCISYGETLLKIDSVSLSYGEKLVLRDVNAEIKDVIRKCHIQGQVVGFLGPSGIGKTSIFRIIAGLEKPTSGSVHINHDPQPVRAGQVGVVAQSYPLFEHRTVWGNLMLGATKKYDKERAAHESLALLDRFGLKDKAHSYPAQLSGGQRQRIAIAAQILCSDHFILLDEPFSGLDILAKENVCRLITEVACMDELSTIIIVSHDIPATASVSDTLWLMGRDRNPDGSIVPGARIQKVHNLVDLGLCWQEHIQLRQDFADFVRSINAEFVNL